MLSEKVNINRLFAINLMNGEPPFCLLTRCDARSLNNFFLTNVFEEKLNYPNFALHTVVVAQLVRASDCGSEGRGFETHHPPRKRGLQTASPAK